jgi:replication-associated recombination protein RarA
MLDEKLLWVDKYRPQTLKDLVLNSETKKYFKNMIKSKNILNLTFTGPAGIGKSTICKVICNEMDADVLFIPCAVKGTVATAQGELKAFCDAMSIEDKMKIVILDEVDAASAS